MGGGLRGASLAKSAAAHPMPVPDTLLVYYRGVQIRPCSPVRGRPGADVAERSASETPGISLTGRHTNHAHQWRYKNNSCIFNTDEG